MDEEASRDHAHTASARAITEPAPGCPRCATLRALLDFEEARRVAVEERLAEALGVAK